MSKIIKHYTLSQISWCYSTPETRYPLNSYVATPCQLICSNERLLASREREKKHPCILSAIRTVFVLNYYVNITEYENLPYVSLIFIGSIKK